MGIIILAANFPLGPDASSFGLSFGFVYNFTEYFDVVCLHFHSFEEANFRNQMKRFRSTVGQLIVVSFHGAIGSCALGQCESMVRTS